VKSNAVCWAACGAACYAAAQDGGEVDEGELNGFKFVKNIVYGPDGKVIYTA
jgi:hypothetical protein